MEPTSRESKGMLQRHEWIFAPDTGGNIHDDLNAERRYILGIACMEVLVLAQGSPESAE